MWLNFQICGEYFFRDIINTAFVFAFFCLFYFISCFCCSFFFESNQDAICRLAVNHSCYD